MNFFFVLNISFYMSFISNFNIFSFFCVYGNPDKKREKGGGLRSDRATFYIARSKLYIETSVKLDFEPRGPEYYI